MGSQRQASRFLRFSRSDWAQLRANTPLLLSEADLVELRGLNEVLSLDEVVDIYLPLSRLLGLQFLGSRALRATTQTFLGDRSESVPFLIGLAGSVAVGKSTTSRILRALLAHWSEHPRVELVTTDGFLLPNATLEARGLLGRKGFPESYDTSRLLRFLDDVKSGVPEVTVPVYSHQRYDIVTGEVQTIRKPDIVIVEGLNVLQPPPAQALSKSRLYVSDFFDFSIYVDANETDIEKWYVDRFLELRVTAFSDPASYHHHYAALSEADAVRTAKRIWADINGKNLRENIAPTKPRADLVLHKGADHLVREVLLRRL